MNNKKVHCKFAHSQLNMHWLWVVFFVATLHLQHVKALPAVLKGQKPAPITDFADILKFDFSPNGIKKELNFDMDVFALRSRQDLKFGAQPNSEEFVRKKRAVNNIPESAPCHTMGGMGGGGAGADDVEGRKYSAKKSKVSARAKSMLNKLKKKKKLVSNEEATHSRRRRDTQDFADKANEFLKKTKNGFLSFIDKIRNFGKNMVENIKSN